MYDIVCYARECFINVCIILYKYRSRDVFYNNNRVTKRYFIYSDRFFRPFRNDTLTITWGKKETFIILFLRFTNFTRLSVRRARSTVVRVVLKSADGCGPVVVWSVRSGSSFSRGRLLCDRRCACV